MIKEISIGLSILVVLSIAIGIAPIFTSVVLGTAFVLAFCWAVGYAILDEYKDYKWNQTCKSILEE
jgi:hypothetical protein